MEETNMNDKLIVPIDYEHQMFLNKTANPYEIAVATAKYARSVNDRIRKYFGPEVSVQPRNIAMKKMENDDTQIVYEQPAQPKDDETAPSPESAKG